MKRRLINIVAVSLLTMFWATSCTDMLKEEPYGATTTESFLKADIHNFELLLGQTYADIKWLHDHWTYWGLCTLTTDEAVCPIRMPGSHWADSSFWTELNTHTWNSAGDAFNNVWYYCNHGAVLCNKIISQLEANKDLFEESVYFKYMSELIVVRSFYYYTLFDCFGRIPYTEKYSDEFVDLATPEYTWTHLIDNLEKYAPTMPLATDNGWNYNYARATQGMAYTLLARLYLNAASYDVPVATIAQYDVYNKCVAACNKVIESGVYKVEDEFFTNFAIKNDVSRENIFVIKEDGSANDAQSSGNPMNKFRVSLLTMHYNHQQVWHTQIKPWNGFCASNEFIAKYSAEDYRGLCDASLEKGGTRVVGKTGKEGRRGWFVGPVYNEDNTAVATDENDEEVILTAKLYGFDDKYQFAFKNKQKLTAAKKDQMEMLNSYLAETSQPYGPYEVGQTLPDDKDLVTKWNKDLNKKYMVERIQTKEATVENTTWNSGARCWKYEADKTGEYMYNENDFVFFRYADVLYMKAEACLRGATNGNVGEVIGMADFQKLRTRVNLEPYTASTLTLDEIYEERSREFAWETVHRRDMIRYGLYTTATWGFVTGHGDYLKWFPIHRDVLAAEPRWTQNQGY